MPLENKKEHLLGLPDLDIKTNCDWKSNCDMIHDIGGIDPFQIIIFIIIERNRIALYTSPYCDFNGSSINCEALKNQTFYCDSSIGDQECTTMHCNSSSSCWYFLVCVVDPLTIFDIPRTQSLTELNLHSPPVYKHTVFISTLSVYCL